MTAYNNKFPTGRSTNLMNFLVRKKIRFLNLILPPVVLLIMALTLLHKLPKESQAHLNDDIPVDNGQYISDKPFVNFDSPLQLRDPLKTLRTPSIAMQTPHYDSKPLPSSDHILGHPSTIYTDVAHLKAGTGRPIKDYYDLLIQPTGYCRKLARVGGAVWCAPNNSSVPIFDGHKLVCLDPELQVGGTLTTEDCLVLSFGVSVDVSFDTAIRNANCRVHLFDIHNYKKYVRQIHRPHVYFHKIGLGAENTKIYYTIKNKKFNLTFFKLESVMQTLNLTNNIINILKIDIEGDEWPALLQILQTTGLLNVIGQIAIEVHAFSGDLMVKRPLEDPAKYKKIREILLQLEESGFRRVSYMDNVQTISRVEDEDGMERDSAGELLLVNSNWYNQTFRREAKYMGLGFW